VRVPVGVGAIRHGAGDEEWPRVTSGSPVTPSGLLEQLAYRVGVDAVMIQHVVSDHANVLRSHELLIEGIWI